MLQRGSGLVFSTFSVSLIALGALALSCGGSTPQAAAPEPTAEAAEPVEPAEAAPSAVSESAPSADKGSLPEACGSAKSDCLPPGAFVNKLCSKTFPDVALYLFRQGTPWQRLYLRGRTPAMNASGGASGGGFLEFDEEVLVLKHRGPDASGIQVGNGNGQYDALRWDGSCVSLEGEEVTTKMPPKVKNSRIEWRWIGDEMRDALLRDKSLAEALKARQKECKGATSGDVSKKCVQLDEKLMLLIAGYVRSHADLPVPSERP